MKEIVLLPGDGVGLEVIPAAEKLLVAMGLDLRFSYAEAGWETFQKTGSSVPEATLEQLRGADATLAGAFTSPTSGQKVAGFFSAIRTIRNALELFANLRPAVSRPLTGSQAGIDILLVRENTEGLYVNGERRYGDTAIADCVITKAASARIARVACARAKARSGRLAVVHKANVLPLTSGLFLKTVLEVAEAYPELEVTPVIVDAAAMKLVRDPQSFDVLVTTNLFGDILSDLTAGLVGGLGVAPSANIGEQHAVFESVHGSAPDIAGKGVANPVATFLSAAMMLRYLQEDEAALRLEQAVDAALAQGTMTPDLGGSATTASFTQAVIANL